jgi:hypothetical protein
MCGSATYRWWFLGAVGVIAVLAGCEGGGLPGGGGGFLNTNDNGQANDNTSAGGGLTLEMLATNTGGASGLAVRPADGALFLVNTNGLFGPIEDGADVASMTPIGATNLADADLFDAPQPSLVLAITESGEFWIGSGCCATLAVVPPEGSDAEPFTALLTEPTPADPSNIKPETMAIVPAGFDGAQMQPGNLLVGRETSFSELSAIDVENDRGVVNIDNPDALLNRNAHHLVFGPDGTLYTSRSTTSAATAGIQTVDPDGRPHDLPGTTGLSAHSFVVLDNNNLIIRGVHSPIGGASASGILIWSAANHEVQVGLTLPSDELSENDEMILAPDGAIYLALPERNEIVRVVVNP